MYKSNRYIIQLVLLASLITFTCSASSSSDKKISSPTTIPLLYFGKNVYHCGFDSPEQFYWNVAQPELTLLNEETHGFFGILMDKLEESLSNSDFDSEEEEKLEESWIYIMETIQASLENSLERSTMSWALLVAVSDTPPLPWEVSLKRKILREVINELEYNYVMIGAVVKAGVKEIVGTLQKQIVQVIQQLEKHVAELTKEGEEVEEMKLLQKMEQSFEMMNSSDFISKLMRRIVNKSMPSSSQNKNRSPMKVFFSSMMEQTAIVFEAYRQKGHIYDKFWVEISHIMKKEVDSNPLDLSTFLHLFNSNNELFVENVFAILVSAIPNSQKYM